MNTDNNYQGWTNYETWLANLWIDNDYGSYQYRCELVQQVKEEHQEENKRKNCLASSLQNWQSESNPLASESSLFADLLNSAMSQVNWQELAENFLEE